MGIVHPGERNPNWRGGRSISSSKYVLVRVGAGHHLADVRGYAYEHRLVAEEMLGRRLEPGEIVHHRNGDKLDNRPANLEVVASIAHHRQEHRARQRGLRTIGEPNPTVACECGCGTTFVKYDGANRPRRFVTGHNGRRANG